jgi:hypothetical protein
MASHVIAQVPLESILATVSEFIGGRAARTDDDATPPPMPDAGIGERTATTTAAAAVAEPADA